MLYKVQINATCNVRTFEVECYCLRKMLFSKTYLERRRLYYIRYTMYNAQFCSAQCNIQLVYIELHTYFLR